MTPENSNAFQRESLLPAHAIGKLLYEPIRFGLEVTSPFPLVGCERETACECTASIGRPICLQNRSRNVEPVKPSLPGPYVIPLVNFDIARRPLSAARECSTGPSGSSPDSRTGSVRTGTDLGT